MKFIVDGYIIEVKAKRISESRCSKDATMGFMNTVSIWMDDSARYDAFENKNDSHWYDDKPDAIEVSKRCAEYLRRESNKLYEQLKDYGCYDKYDTL